jgi:hypothetical protein
MAYTVAEIRTRTRNILNETTGTFYSDTELEEWIGDAALDIAGIAKCVEAFTQIAMQSGARHYGLPTDTVEVLHAQEEATGKGLARITPSMAGHEDATVAGPDPLRWYEFAARFWIEPIPDSTMQGKNVVLFYARTTQDIETIPEYCQLLAIDYALYRALEKDRRYSEAGAVYSAYLSALTVRRNDVYQRVAHVRQDLMIADVAVER